MTEEERRRCIILGGCPPASLEAAMREEMALAAGDDPGQWSQLPKARRRRYERQAKHFLSVFTFSAKEE